jgi:beta-glucosidase-like glycosyl hydrolase
LSGKIGAEMTRGIQTSGQARPGKNFVKALGALKHFSVYSMENSCHDGLPGCSRVGSKGQHVSGRFGFNPTISLHDMADSYLAQYKIGIQEGGALGMMCSYTSVNDTAFCESVQWQQKWARDKLGFEGNIVTDWCDWLAHLRGASCAAPIFPHPPCCRSFLFRLI